MCNFSGREFFPNGIGSVVFLGYLDIYLFRRTDENAPQRYWLYQLPVCLWITVTSSVAMKNIGGTRAQSTMRVLTRQMIGGGGQPAKDGAISETAEGYFTEKIPQ